MGIYILTAKVLQEFNFQNTFGMPVSFVRKLIVFLILIALPLDSLYAAAATYWVHKDSAAHQKHVGHYSHTHHLAQSDSAGRHSLFHGQKGSWDCPIYHYVAGMSTALPSSTMQLAIVAQCPIPLSMIVIFRSIHLKVPQHRDKTRLA